MTARAVLGIEYGTASHVLDRSVGEYRPGGNRRRATKGNCDDYATLESLHRYLPNGDQDFPPSVLWSTSFSPVAA